MINLESTAKNVVADALPVDGKLDIDALEDELCEYIESATDSVCIYYHDCEDIISRYETDPNADTDSADDMGQTFKPSEYQQAMVAYAYWIARSVIAANAYEIVGEIREAVDDLESELAELNVDVVGEYRISRDCPHGWSVHNRENERGGCFWLSRQLDGCNAVAIPVAGVWISYTYEPAMA